MGHFTTVSRAMKFYEEVTGDWLKEKEQILKFIGCPPFAACTLQIKAFLSTVYSCGLRLAVALNLTIDDVDRARMMLRVRKGKGDKGRDVPLPESTCALLRAYWKTHRNPRLLFPALGRSGNQGADALRPMAQGSVQGALRRILKELPQIRKE